MNNIELDIVINAELTDEEKGFFEEEYLKEFLKKIIDGETNTNITYYISLTITNNEEIHMINREYRGKDMPTDVISFAYGDSEEFYSDYRVLGDIILSMDKVREQAKEFSHSIKRETFYLLCHSTLHLLGHDHMIDEEKKVMREKEEKYLNYFDITRGEISDR